MLAANSGQEQQRGLLIERLTFSAFYYYVNRSK